MKKVTITTGVVLTLLFSNCVSRSFTYRKQDIEKKNALTNSAVVDAKINVGKKIEATSSAQSSIKAAKSEAQYKAITQNNIDFIVDPIFQITSSFKTFTAKVTGYAGTYTNARTVTEEIKNTSSINKEDIEKFNAIYNNSSYSNNQEDKKPIGNFGLFGKLLK